MRHPGDISWPVSVWAGSCEVSSQIVRSSPAVCVCDCHCAVQRAAESSSSSVWVVALIILCAIAILGAAGFALAVKLTFVHKGEEREVAIHLKGKSKGVYNPAKPLQILG